MIPSFRSLAIVSTVLATLGVFAPAQSQPARPPPPALPDGPWDIRTETGLIHVSVLTKDLQSPWGLAFLPDGGMLVTERPGRLRVIRDGKLDPKPIEGLPDLVSHGHQRTLRYRAASRLRAATGSSTLRIPSRNRRTATR